MTDTAIPVQAVSVSPATANVEPAKKPDFGAVTRSAGLRAARTFTQAFLAVLLPSQLVGVNVGLLKSAGVAGFTAVLTLVQRGLDATPIPTIPAG